MTSPGSCDDRTQNKLSGPRFVHISLSYSECNTLSHKHVPSRVFEEIIDARTSDARLGDNPPAPAFVFFGFRVSPCPAAPDRQDPVALTHSSLAADTPGPCVSTVCVLGHFSRVRLSVTPWTLARQAPLSMGFSRQEYWSGLHFLLQGIFSTQGLDLHLLHWQVDSLPLSHQGSPQVMLCS